MEFADDPRYLLMSKDVGRVAEIEVKRTVKMNARFSWQIHVESKEFFRIFECEAIGRDKR